MTIDIKADHSTQLKLGEDYWEETWNNFWYNGKRLILTWTMHACLQTKLTSHPWWVDANIIESRLIVPSYINKINYIYQDKILYKIRYNSQKRCSWLLTLNCDIIWSFHATYVCVCVWTKGFDRVWVCPVIVSPGISLSSNLHNNKLKLYISCWGSLTCPIIFNFCNQ